jgi:hypothetical protein
MIPKSMIRDMYQDYLVPGKTYRVIQPFLDSAKSIHRAGETWVFLGYIPSGFGEATNIYIKKQDGAEGAFGIDWNSSENNLGLENLKAFIQEAP